MALISLTIAWSLGILLVRQLGPSPVLLGASAALSLLVSLRGRDARLRLGGILLLAMALGGLRFVLAQPPEDAQTLARYNGQGIVTLEGWIAGEPSERATSTQLEISADSLVLDDGTVTPVRGKALVTVGRYPAYAYGDRLRIKARLVEPDIQDLPGYRDYLASRGIGSLLRQAVMERLPGVRGWAALRHIYKFKAALQRLIADLLPEPAAGLLSGILLGLDHTLPAYLVEAFRAAGLTHIIVISGYNISLVVQIVMVAGMRLAHRLRLLLVSLVAIALFVLLVGPSAPVARAAIMGCLFVLAQLVGRRAHGLTSLAAASLAMTAANPLLLWSVSFQLSLAATLGLILIEPVLSRRTRAWLLDPAGSGKNGRHRNIVRVLAPTLAAQVLTLPIVWLHFGEVSLVSLPANLLVLPFQSSIMALSLPTLLTGWASPALGRIVALPLWLLLEWCMHVTEWLAALPWAQPEVPRLGAGVVWGFYGLLGLTLATEKRPGWWAGISQRLVSALAGWRLVAILALVTVLIWVAVPSLPDGRLHLYFMDVGQGDAILVRSPGGRTVLIDGGPDPVTLTSRLGRILPFWQRHIDLVVVTHADQDHLGGLIPVLERYKVGQVIQSPVMKDSALSRRWQEVLQANGAEVLVAERGLEAHLGESLLLTVLHPPGGLDEQEGMDDNENSVVLRLDMGAFSTLLAADAGAQAEGQLLASGLPLAALVLKVAHHGSETGSGAAFLQAVAPRYAIVSVGADNRFGLPSEVVIERLDALGCQVWRTDQQGTVEVVSDGTRLWVETGSGAELFVR
ncbi:MAG: DNA internalization-related competence protein ComEC/Rec2 [Anaerolineae bacterium]